MARLTADADRQFQRLSRHFLRIGRTRAAELLTGAVADARRAADDPSTVTLPAPRPYPELAQLHYRWIKLHRYWFGYRIGEDGEAVIGHIGFEQSDLPRRITPRTPELD